MIMGKKTNKPKIVYYEDERHDDFASADIKNKGVRSNYPYFNRNIFSRTGGWVFRQIIAIPLLLLANLLIYQSRVKNRRVLKGVKKTGYYMYANHVLDYDPITHPILLNPSKFCVVVSGPEAFSIHPIVSWMVKSLGAIPIPNKNDLEMFANYTKYLSHHIQKKHRVLIYPEAHIWPYCNFVRDFTPSSFRYPVNDNVPIITATTVFKKKRFKKKPIAYIYIDGPFYANPELTGREKVDDLAYRAQQAMKKRSEVEWNYSYIKYVKKPREKSPS